MKIASSPMAAIEALQLDVAYVAVAKPLGLPCQSYMALSDAKILDAQAGAETFGSALLAALAGVNSVSGPGMLDFLLVFSLPKLVFDDEMCGQALRFVREVQPEDDLPTQELLEQLMADQHLIMAAAHDRPLARRAVSAERDRRAGQPRELGEGRRQGHLPARGRRGRTAGSRPTASSRPTRRSSPSSNGSSAPGSPSRPTSLPSRHRRTRRSRSRPVRTRRTNPRRQRKQEGPSA